MKTQQEAIDEYLKMTSSLDPVSRKFWEEKCVMEARVVLSDRRSYIMDDPTIEIWIGIHVMERDDRLPKRRS